MVNHKVGMIIVRLDLRHVISNLCDYSDPWILLKGTIRVPNTVAAAAGVNNINEKAMFKNCAPFTDWITEINNT